MTHRGNRGHALVVLTGRTTKFASAMKVRITAGPPAAAPAELRRSECGAARGGVSTGVPVQEPGHVAQHGSEPAQRPGKTSEYQHMADHAIKPFLDLPASPANRGSEMFGVPWQYRSCRWCRRRGTSAAHHLGRN